MNECYFLAVCKDRPNDPNGFWYTVYFVNNSDQNIEQLSYETGGFATLDEDLVQTSTVKKELGKVPAYTAIEVETDDEGAFDFVLHYTFDCSMQNGNFENKSFTIGKYLRGGKNHLSHYRCQEKWATCLGKVNKGRDWEKNVQMILRLNFNIIKKIKGSDPIWNEEPFD